MPRPSTYINTPGVPRAKRLRRKRFCQMCEYVEITSLHGNSRFCTICRVEAKMARARKDDKRQWSLRKLREIRDKRLNETK